MAKRDAGTGTYVDPHTDLFAPLQERQRRRLFLPKFVGPEAADKRLATPRRDAAFEIIRNWWAQALSGRLNRKETSIDDAFLAEVFGQALGYRGVTDSRDAYERERQFHVPGVGPCDGALGHFPPAQADRVWAVIELKDASTNLDRDRSNGRTPVQQLWDYLNAMPESCIWGIVSNFTTIRLYHRASGTQRFEQYTLREMAEDRQVFDRFYAIFEPGGLIKGVLKEPPRAVRLLKRTDERQRKVGDELYTYYSTQRLRLIEHLHRDRGLDIDASIRAAQKLIDRVLFIAFCEDRRLIVHDAIDKAYHAVSHFSKARNPIWQNFLGLFAAMDTGHPSIGVENGYNGGLFHDDELIDSLDLDDQPWTNFFKSLSDYDYEHEVDVDVLGHLFEKSVTELERLREGALFAADRTVLEAPMMPKSPQRKLFGIYYTPPEFTHAIVRYTIGEVIEERFAAARERAGLSDAQLVNGDDNPVIRAYRRECFDILTELRICDPACGSGAFLIQAYEALYEAYGKVVTEIAHFDTGHAQALFDETPDLILSRNLFGVDLQPEAVEIAQLSLWLRTARRGKTLADLSRNIVCGNSLTDDPAAHPRAMRWEDAFPDVFSGDNPGFDCVIGNPPWERLKLQEREFFALSAPRIASAVSAADRRRFIAALENENPELYKTYLQAQGDADRMLAWVRASGRYPLTGKGDINTYALFAELAMRLVAPTGRVGLLVPSGIATDMTTSKFFAALIESMQLRRLHDFENKRGVFKDVHRAFKFSILNFGGSAARFEEVDFVFFAHSMEDVADKKRHIPLTAEDLRRLNPNTATCPIFRDRTSADLTRAIYGRVPVLIDRNRRQGGNPWGVKFIRMFDQTNDAELFQTAEALKNRRYVPEGNRWVKGRKIFLPLYEAKMVQAYDHRAASVEVVKSNWVRQGQTVAPRLVDYQNPEHTAMPRWWVEEGEVKRVLGGELPPALLGFKDITSPTNQRTMIASWIPPAAVTNHFPLIVGNQTERRMCCLLANLNTYAYDFVVRQKIGGITLNFFIVEQLPTFPPDTYDDPCPWDGKQTLEKWISDRVLKLSCTADDMKPLAAACGMKPPVHKWKPQERRRILAELDAAYFILYGVSREDVLYILGTFQGTRADTSQDMFEGRPSEGFSEAGSEVLKAYDELRQR